MIFQTFAFSIKVNDVSIYCSWDFMTSIKYTKKRRGKISDFVLFLSVFWFNVFLYMRITRYLISCNPLIKLNYSRVTFQCGRQSKPYLEHHRIGYIYITAKDWLLKSQENASHNTMYLSFLIHLILYLFPTGRSWYKATV